MFALVNRQYSQVAYVTNDLEGAIGVLKNTYGVPDFYQFSNVQHGQDAEGRAVLKIALELIEPVGDTAPLFSAVLPAGDDLAILFHHVATRIDGPLAHWETHVASLDLERHPVVFEGGLGDMLRFMYTDERPMFGHFVEHVWMSPELLSQMGRLVPSDPHVMQESMCLLLSGVLRTVTDAIIHDRSHPMFVPEIDVCQNIFQPNAETIYKAALIEKGGTYRIRGDRGTTRMMILAQLGPDSLRTHKHHPAQGTNDFDDLQIGPDGSFDVILSEERPDGYSGD